jgi:hypothetical protein
MGDGFHFEQHNLFYYKPQTFENSKHFPDRKKTQRIYPQERICFTPPTFEGTVLVFDHDFTNCASTQCGVLLPDINRIVKLNQGFK